MKYCAFAERRMMPKFLTYLNNNATTKIDDEVKRAMSYYIGMPAQEKADRKTQYHNPNSCEIYYNPSSTGELARSPSDAINVAKTQVASLINAKIEEIIFTSGGSEGNSTVINIAKEFVGKEGVIVKTVAEHDSIRLHCDYLKKQGYNIVELPLTQKGDVDTRAIDDLDSKQKCFFTIMYVNNETGVINPIQSISKKIRAKFKNVLIQTDAVQAVGKIKIDVKELGVDYLSFSGHKIHAPKGIGGLYVRNEIKSSFVPLIFGHQQCERRGGTENVAYIVGLGKAAELAEKISDTSRAKVSAKRDEIEKMIFEKCQKLRLQVVINGKEANRVCNTTNISISSICGQELVDLCEREYELLFSTGAACVTAQKNHCPDFKKSDEYKNKICKGQYEEFVPSKTILSTQSTYPEGTIRISIGEELLSPENEIDDNLRLLRYAENIPIALEKLVLKGGNKNVCDS